MEKPPSSEDWYEKNKERRLEDLRALSEVLGLTILREEIFNGTPSIVVDDGRGEEVHIGFPDGTHSPSGKMAYPPAATGRIWEPPIKMGMYGHGAWRMSIEI